MRENRIIHALAWVLVGIIQAGICLIRGPHAAWCDGTRRMETHIPSGRVRALLPHADCPDPDHWRN
jgi:hypothetical protein